MARTIIRQLPPQHELYPDWLATRYGDQPQLWYAGNLDLLAQPAIAVTGVREMDCAIAKRAISIARVIAVHGYLLVTGLARGVDLAATRLAWEAGACVIGCPAGSLRECVSRHEARAMLDSGRALFLSLYGSNQAFSSARAMARNRFLMRLAQCVIVIASQEGQGGSWAGALAAIRARHRWGVPLTALVTKNNLFCEHGSPINAMTNSPEQRLRDGVTNEEALPSPPKNTNLLTEHGSPINALNNSLEQRLSDGVTESNFDNQSNEALGNDALVEMGAIPLPWPLEIGFVQDFRGWLAEMQELWNEDGQAEFW